MATTPKPPKRSSAPKPNITVGGTSGNYGPKGAKAKGSKGGK
jgi:hypothetical protein